MSAHSIRSSPRSSRSSSFPHSLGARLKWTSSSSRSCASKPWSACTNGKSGCHRRYGSIWKSASQERTLPAATSCAIPSTTRRSWRALRRCSATDTSPCSSTPRSPWLQRFSRTSARRGSRSRSQSSLPCRVWNDLAWSSSAVRGPECGALKQKRHCG